MTVLDNEVMTEIMVPASSQQVQGVYLTISRREAVDLAQVGIAIAARAEDKKTRWRDVRIALGAVAPTPIRAYETEKLLEGREIQRTVIEETVKKAIEEARPITDLRASEWYRREMVSVLAQRALEQLAGQIMGRA
jgi:carbon-monoxide dehydrogenase medium subunit